MPHHAMEILFRHLIFRMAGNRVFVIAPGIVVFLLCLIYAPIAYTMVRSAINGDQS